MIPKALAISNPSRASIPNTVIVNSGSQRFDVYAGPFTRNDQFIVSPFDDAFLYFQTPASIAKQVLDKLNAKGAFRRREVGTGEDPELYARGDVDYRFDAWRRDQFEREYKERATANLTLGYVTTDVSVKSRLGSTVLTLNDGYRAALVSETIRFTRPSRTTTHPGTLRRRSRPELQTTRLSILSSSTFSRRTCSRSLTL